MIGLVGLFSSKAQRGPTNFHRVSWSSATEDSRSGAIPLGPQPPPLPPPQQAAGRPLAQKSELSAPLLVHPLFSHQNNFFFLGRLSVIGIDRICMLDHAKRSYSAAALRHCILHYGVSLSRCVSLSTLNVLEPNTNNFRFLTMHLLVFFVFQCRFYMKKMTTNPSPVSPKFVSVEGGDIFSRSRPDGTILSFVIMKFSEQIDHRDFKFVTGGGGCRLWGKQ